MKPLLEIASPELIEKLFEVGHKKTYWDLDIIFAEGEKAQMLPIVLSGKVKMVRYPEIGKEFIIGFFSNGEVFAIPPALDGKHYPATCVAVENTKLLTLSRPVFLELMQESNEFSAIVLEIMCGLLRESAETINNLANSSPEHRIGNILLRLSADRPTKINLRRQDIADMAGLATETTIRVIKRMADKDLLKIERGKIILEQPERLRDFLR